ncbi:MAG: hypothetical protein ACKOPO_02130 [Novosphingobium sp.]
MIDTAFARPKVPAGFILKLALPFAIPIVVTLAMVLLVGERWPRNIVPGAGLKLAGLGATALTGYAVWRHAVSRFADERVHKFAAALCTVTALMGWPVWTVGPLPSINGAMLRDERDVTMVLERTETTFKSKSRELYHWAWLKPAGLESDAPAGRYFIPEGIYQSWSAKHPATVRLTLARGLLGADVSIGWDGQKAR